MINVIGLGYIGLPTSLMLAMAGQEVTGTDYNQSLVEKLQNGQVTFEEKGLDELFKSAVEKGIVFTTEYIEAEYYIVAVPTPYNKADKKLDPSYVIDAVKKILEVCKSDSIIIVESTISPKTIEMFIKPMIIQYNQEHNSGVQVAHAPERIVPGNMLYELINNSRTIGADNLLIGAKVKEIYASFCKGEIVLTDIRTAEMSKVVENTYRDINIAFANELAKICRSDNMDVYEIIQIANRHPRVNILQPGPGVGGHCISVDPWFLVGDYPGLANIILAARKINDSMPEFVIERIRYIMEEKGIKDIGKVGLYGLTYKENVDDVRESPTLQLLDNLKGHLAFGMKSYDPYIKRKIVDDQVLDFDQFLSEIELLVIMVGHDDLVKNMDKIKDKVILDTRNICKLDNVYKL